jgi:ketosteroid isomerase-like protein
MSASTQPNSAAVIERMRRALNQHDLEAFLACFDPDYRSEQPVHPDRGFGGREQVRKNWSGIFSAFPDFQAELLRSAAESDMIWAEWRWTGARADGSRLDMRGVTLMGTRDDRIVWGRLYMEEAQETGAGIDAAVQRMAEGSQPDR